MDETKIRRIVQDEIRKQSSASRFTLNFLQRHIHNGLDSPKISQANILPNTALTGSITMAQETQYRIGVNFNPTSVLFNGIVTNLGSGIRAHCIGTANFGPSYYLQPSSTTSVTVGGPLQNIIQSSSMLLTDNSGLSPVFRALVDEGHIIDVEYGGIKARATITGYDTDAITVNVETLDTGYSIIGNWVIT